MPTKTAALPIGERIRAANTELQAADAISDKIGRFAAARQPHSVDAEYIEKMLAGADPADILDDYCAAKARENAEAAFRALTANVMQRIADPRRYEEHFADTAIEMCREELDTIMSRVAANRELIEQHPDTIEAALSSGNLADWETVEQILADYDALRTEYNRQIRRQDQTLNTRISNSFQCRDFLTIDPHWAFKRRTARIVDNYPAPEMIQFFRGDMPDTTTPTPTQWILAVADHQPWLPDAAQIAALNHKLEQLCTYPWHTDRIRADRTWFAENLAEIRIITSQ